MTLDVRKVAPGEYPWVILRTQDAEECLALGHSPRDILADSLLRSDEAWEYSVDGFPLAYWGLRREPPDASVWMLTTSLADSPRLRFEIAKESARIVDGLEEAFSALTVEVHGDYDLSVRWLTWLGFRRYGVRMYNGEEFLLMRKGT